MTTVLLVNGSHQHDEVTDPNKEQEHVDTPHPHPPSKSTNRASAVTVYYDDSQAPSFNSLIDRGAAIWNARVCKSSSYRGRRGTRR